MDSWRVAALLLAVCFSASATEHFHTECYTANGEDYRGRQNQTSLQGGRPCLFWNETFERPYNTNKYPNGEGGLGQHNFCRNPDGDVRPWCYIADLEDGSYWKYCDIPTCQMPGNLGCFKDSGDPTPLSGSHQTSTKLTIQNCISFCRNQRYKLAGMESGYACFCGDDREYHRHGDAPNTECNHVCFGDHTQPCGGDGRIIVFDTKVGACGGNFTSPSAVIYSPDFPGKYRSGSVCYWTIQVPGSSVILFNFTFFSIVDQKDMVELLDGKTNQVVARFDGRNPPRDIVNITADFVILYFYSDRTNEALGFSVVYHALRNPAFRPEEEDNGDEEDTSTMRPNSGSTTTKSNTSQSGKSSHLYYVITSSPANMPVWTIYALAALLTLTVIAMVAKLLLHLTVKSPSIPSISGSESCAQSTTSEPWIILYRPSTISLFKKKLKNHHGDLSPLVGN
ncbi:kremen protein 1 isoform X1 [Danio rerio]|uniref:Kringle-containing protein marking the eye and the nose n=1 Tax=Danio rerio TaxID=7955 RepID=A0A8M3ARY7_DANRE|nr:kremen protein 1 isoform X1 [Danio rerio]|eukprot:XP_009299499.1 kremen protein 1 isoform X1 [Danio rerio]